LRQGYGLGGLCDERSVDLFLSRRQTPWSITKDRTAIPSVEPIPSPHNLSGLNAALGIPAIANIIHQDRDTNTRPPDHPTSLWNQQPGKTQYYLTITTGVPWLEYFHGKRYAAQDIRNLLSHLHTLLQLCMQSGKRPLMNEASRIRFRVRGEDIEEEDYRSLVIILVVQ
jgi:hypothetical protein